MKYVFHGTQLSFLRLTLSCNDNRFACTSFEKNVFEILNTSRFAPSRIRLKKLHRDKRAGSGVLFWDYPGYSYSGLGIIEYQEYRLPKRMQRSYSDLNQNVPTAFRSICYREYIIKRKARDDIQTEKTVTVYCLLFRVRHQKGCPKYRHY